MNKGSCMLKENKGMFMADNSQKNNSPNNKKDKNDKKGFGGLPQKPDGDFDWNKVIKTVFSWGLVIIAAVVVMQFWNNDKSGTVDLPLEYYKTFLSEDKIASAKIVKSDVNDYSFIGTLKKPEKIQLKGTWINVKKFSTTLFEVYLPGERKLWEAHKVKYTFEKDSNEWTSLLIGIIPWVLIFGIWILFMRRMQGAGGAGGQRGIFSFGKSKAKLITNTTSKVTFKDVAGADEAKQELEEVIEFLREPGKFQKLGGKIPRGVLLVGPPGTGKTLLARAVAGEAAVPFFSISGADFVEMFVGVGASRVRDLFEQGKKNSPCIIFIDEIDAVGRHRGAGLGGGNDEREQTLNALLVEMDGFDQNSGVIIIAATNRPDVLDPALLRPGRFDRQVVVDRPDVRGREGILKVHTRNTPLDKTVNIKVLAKGTPGLAGADLANLVNEAALLAARKNKKKIDMEDFEEAKDKVMMGAERKSMIITEEEKKITAYHECGHVLAAKLVPGSDPVHKVTIIPRGRALGITSYLPVDEKHTYSKTYIESKLISLLGGRAAELLIFNEYTTGAGNDIERATDLAKKMVCEWGMSEKLGPLTYGKNEENLFLGREVTKHQEYSESTAQMIDEEVKRIVVTAMEKTDKLLKDNIDTLHRISLELLEREILDGTEIDKLINGEDLPPVVKNGNGTKVEKNTEDSNVVPDYVKKMIDEKEQKNSTEKENQSGNDKE